MFVEKNYIAIHAKPLILKEIPRLLKKSAIREEIPEFEKKSTIPKQIYRFTRKRTILKEMSTFTFSEITNDTISITQQHFRASQRPAPFSSDWNREAERAQ